MQLPEGDGLLNVAGQQAVALSLPTGDRVVVCLHGAQVLSWKTADGREHLYLSPRAAINGAGAIRGGMPICFPQFNQRVIDGRPLPKHGFARVSAWRCIEIRRDGPAGLLRFALENTDLASALRTAWPFVFSAELVVHLSAGVLRVEFGLRNHGKRPLAFALALHTYLNVEDISRLSLEGLEQCPYWDAVLDPNDMSREQPAGGLPVRLSGETDRVYRRPPARLRLREADRLLSIEQSNSFTETVVWNPGAELCASLADLPPEGYKHMLCIEAARIDEAVNLAPGQSWRGWQQFESAGDQMAEESRSRTYPGSSGDPNRV